MGALDDQVRSAGQGSRRESGPGKESQVGPVGLIYDQGKIMGMADGGNGPDVRQDPLVSGAGQDDRPDGRIRLQQASDRLRGNTAADPVIRNGLRQDPDCFQAAQLYGMIYRFRAARMPARMPQVLPPTR